MLLYATEPYRPKPCFNGHELLESAQSSACDSAMGQPCSPMEQVRPMGFPSLGFFEQTLRTRADRFVFRWWMCTYTMICLCATR